MRRNRFLYFVAGCLVVALGLGSRFYAGELPVFAARYSGDTLWALMVFVGIGFLLPNWPTALVGITALLVSYIVEFSQLYHSPWIDGIRRTRLGGLVLGSGFLWSDLLCYTVGVLFGVAVEVMFLKWARPLQQDLNG